MPLQENIRFNSPTVVNLSIDGFGSSASGDAPDLGRTEGQDKEVKRLRRQNSLYVQYAPLWKFYLNAYEGGIDFANSENLFQHARENQQDYKDRVARIHNFNYCEPLVDFFTNFIFSEAIDRTGGSNKDFYIKFVEDVDKRGNNIDAFMRQVSDDMQIFGMAYVLVDSPAGPNDETGVVDDDRAPIVTKADEDYAGIRPYWVLIKPDEIIDWLVDEFGTFTYVKRFQTMEKMLNGEIHVIEHYTEFYPDKTVVSEVDITKAAEVEYLGSKTYSNPFGDEIPIRIARYKRSKRFAHMGQSFLTDFAFNNREIMNLTSLLQEFLYRQAFNILAKEVESGVPLREQEDGVVGTANVMEYPKGAKEPKYISPPADPAKFIQEERARIKNEMFVRAAQDALTELFNGEKASGFSQAQSFAKTVPFIANRADTLERMEVALMELTMEMVSKKWDGKIKYKDRYELTNLSDALVQLQILVRDFNMPSATFVKEELKRMIREFDGKMPVETLIQVESEIDGMDFEKWMEVQNQALVGAPGGKGSSPGAQQQPKDTMTLRESASEAKVKTTATTKLKE